MDEVGVRDRLTFGIPRLDSQHEQLLQLVRQMREADAGGKSLCELRLLAATLTLHTRMHFMDEEMFMEGAGYPGLEAHRRRHAEFTEGLLRLQSGLLSTSRSQFARIVEYELGWIHQHLEDEDNELGRWLEENKIFAESLDWEAPPGPGSIPISSP
ncbi:Hemerythrin-like, metal-binding protein [Candidatus Koribacter versatilis Ellin345]|uniref:Hemerythrin-like, metal-binding protein n=1 Tax=Koribacter versatilis (strain Ellin345) TaxID=204669 RepID=Q1IKF0_KORVE|nr:hemerythrin family protein [Candidatus Koribacter versatilis]ABF42650.1 Hemerythrin-like, metal-binding protein [Candidatus Koribacter versatilis Ellin345]